MDTMKDIGKSVKSIFVNDQDQIQKTKEIQMFKEQVVDTFDAVTIAAEMSQDKTCKQSTVNRLTDGAILSLNAWIVSCKDMIKDNNKDALKIAEKEINDTWNKLRSKDINTYNLTIKHRDFMIAAVKGQAKKFNHKRVNKSQRKLFDTNAQTINQTYGRLIAEQQKYDEHIKSFEDPKINKQLQLQHANDLKIIRANEKNLKNQTKNKSNKYKQSNVSDLYFTKSGRDSKFQSRTHKIEQKDMENELYGIENAYDKLPKTGYKNALIMKYNNGKMFYTPCKIMNPVQNHLDKICVTPAYPNHYQTELYDKNFIVCDVNTVQQYEEMHLNKYSQLGYPSIKQQKTAVNDRNNQIASQIMNGTVDTNMQAQSPQIMQSAQSSLVLTSMFKRKQQIICRGKYNRKARIQAIDDTFGIKVLYEDNQKSEWIQINELGKKIVNYQSYQNKQKKEPMSEDDA